MLFDMYNFPSILTAKAAQISVVGWKKHRPSSSVHLSIQEWILPKVVHGKERSFSVGRKAKSNHRECEVWYVYAYDEVYLHWHVCCTRNRYWDTGRWRWPRRMQDWKGRKNTWSNLRSERRKKTGCIWSVQWKTKNKIWKRRQKGNTKNSIESTKQTAK